MTRVALVIPTLGSATFEDCLRGVAELDPGPSTVVVVRSGSDRQGTDLGDVTTIHFTERLGFARAVNAGIAAVAGRADLLAVLNDDAVPTPDWLAGLIRVMESDPSIAATQGTVTDGAGSLVDGRGIGWDTCDLPVQVGRGEPADAEPGDPHPLVAVSATAAVYRMEALRQVAMPDSAVFDPTFDCYHEDLDLGLRLSRIGWRAVWVPGSTCRHLGSATGTSFPWRHPWWVLANRWRAMAGNLAPRALAMHLPRLLRGELRAVRALSRRNSRALLAGAAVAAAWPVLIVDGWRRMTPGDRLLRLPGGTE